jgi:hypothetical protein
MFLVARGFLDLYREGTVSFPVPADPLLVGQTLHWQAILGSPLRLTNREQTTFTP